MTIKFFTSLRALVAATCLATLAAGCATPQPGPEFDRASKAIRAAETAGAAQHAPVPFNKANEIYHRAEVMLQKRRSNRAHKLLELATAQANLAKVISDGEEAKSSLGFIRTGQPR